MNVTKRRLSSAQRSQNKEALIHKKCAESKLTKCLDLSGIRLFEIPKSVLRLNTVLRHLYLHNCSLKDEFPFHIVHLNNLETLDLSQNGISVIPESFCMTAKRLRVFDVSFNNLSRLPGAIEELESLVELNAAHNKLIYIPSELGRLSNIQEIDLNSNLILGLPTALFEDRAVFSLKKLDLSHNQLGELPFSLGNVSGLLSLKVTGNMLKYIPSTCKKLNVLETFHYGDNEWFEQSIHDTKGKAYGLKALIQVMTFSL